MYGQAAGAIRDQPVNILDAESGEKICVVQAGPKTDISRIKQMVSQDAGIPTREILIVSGGYKFKDNEHVGMGIFSEAADNQAQPELQLKRLSTEEADREEGREKALEFLKRDPHHRIT